MDMFLKGGNDATLSPGSFTWDIVLDRLWGDTNLAHILKLPAALMDEGISIIEYLNLVHPEDRANLAEKVHKSILNASSWCESHRLLCDGDLEPRWVTVYGHCYRVQDGLPTLCSGTIERIRISEPRPTVANGNHLAPHSHPDESF
ncbi:PAS domain-containing protein [Neorhizobium sp. CSC1952]|uniref:PAS fold-containing protein n=1 Tax=Xaviernesmea oryzae TaxID=464029 RepID=A0A1X7F1R3_9HYPH|nr:MULTISPECIES: PAS domain-containing protein [Rhizobium/Agrobacterium group]WJR68021.1 PAS domain-containing protein [Rhizobium sp. CSC1952]SMF44336.1 PAS fold-containing protein [Xaviernesmea oryzae]